MKGQFGKVWNYISDKVDEHQQYQDQRFEESNHNKSLKEMFAENEGGDVIQRDYNEGMGTVEYQAVANRKKDDMQVSSQKTLTTKARAMKWISRGFKPFSFYGSFYSMQTEISNSFSISPTDFATLFIAISLSFLIEVLLHFEATSIFNQREKPLTRMVGTVVFTLLLSINMYMHFNTAMIMREVYSSSHEKNIMEDLTSPDAMFIKSTISSLKGEIKDEQSSVNDEVNLVKQQRKSFLSQRAMYQNSHEYLLSKHESKRRRGRDAIAVVDLNLKNLKVDKSVLNALKQSLMIQQKKLTAMSNEQLGTVKASGDRAMYVAIVLLLIVEIGSRLDLYFYFITRFNLTVAVLAMSKKAFDGLGILEQVQDIFAQFEGRLRVVANQQQTLATTLVEGQERELNYMLLNTASQRQESNKTREVIIGMLDNGYGYSGKDYTDYGEGFSSSPGTAYDYDEHAPIEEKTADGLQEEHRLLTEYLHSELDTSFYLIFDASVKGAKLEGKVISLQENMTFPEKENKIKHEIAHIRAGSRTHDYKFKKEAENLGVERRQPKPEGIISRLRAYDIYRDLVRVMVSQKTTLQLTEAETIELQKLGVVDMHNVLLIPSSIALERMLGE